MDYGRQRGSNEHWTIQGQTRKMPLSEAHRTIRAKFPNAYWNATIGVGYWWESADTCTSPIIGQAIAVPTRLLPADGTDLWYVRFAQEVAS